MYVSWGLIFVVLQPDPSLDSVIVFNVHHSLCTLIDVPEVHVSRVQEVSLVNHVPHPLAVVHVTLTSLYAGR